MDYNLTKTVQGKIEYNIDQAMPFGDMAPSMLTSKFEETDMGPDEDLYDDYSRSILCDWRPDTNKFEHEEPRGGVNRRAGRIQLQYEGHRGSAETPYRPEYFDGFAGPEDRDPRGINTDPDMKELVKQEQSRMRFVRLTPDGSDHITGGGRSESQVIADQQKLFKQVRSRLKVFDRQIDGRREGLRREFKHRSEKNKQVRVQSYGDYIKDYALNPQRRANIICREILRDTRAWRDETADADFSFARYTQLCRRARAKLADHSRVVDDRDGKRADLQDPDPRLYKAVGLLMANITKSRRDGMESARSGGIDMGEAKHTAIRKTEPFTRDLSAMLHAMTPDAEFAVGDTTMTQKTSPMTDLPALARQVVYNHITPAHHHLNAEVIYKSVKPGADTRKVGDKVITDARWGVRNAGTKRGKTARREVLTGAKLNTTNDADSQESKKTFNYRKALSVNGDRRIRNVKTDARSTESARTQDRRPLHTNYRSTNVDDLETMQNYGDNAVKERHGRGLGSKYMTRFIDQDGRADEISVAS